ncbi:carboxylesterase family protein [Caballeronia sp. S22]|uniref:carboxylesterase family protein n=1 Tax=Caballeronia sp. S22 TaxID=3137182 RepID=UPI003530A5B5
MFSRNRDDKYGPPVHGDELEYVFGTLAARHRGQAQPFNQRDEVVSRDMQAPWVAFAETGNPNKSMA